MPDKEIFVLKIVWRKSIASLHRLTQAVQRANLRRTAGDPTWVLLFSLFWYLKKHVNERIQIIMKKPEYPTSSGSLRLIQIAILTEIENRTEAVKIFIHDANTHKGCTICYFKVIIFYTVPLNMFKICYNSYL